MLERLRDPGKLAAFVASVVSQAKRSGNFMPIRYSTAEILEPGGHMLLNERMRGISATPPARLTGRLWLDPGSDARGFDWHPAEGYRDNPVRWRWSGPNPHPRLRIPVATKARVRFTVHIATFGSETGRESPAIFVNENPVASELVFNSETGSYLLTFVAPLRVDRASVVEFRTGDNLQTSSLESRLTDKRFRGFCLLGTGLEFASMQPKLGNWTEANLALRDWALSQREEAIFALAAIRESRTWRYSALLRAVRAMIRGR